MGVAGSGAGSAAQAAHEKAKIPNEPILEVQPEENETTCAPKNEPILPSNRRIDEDEAAGVGGQFCRLAPACACDVISSPALSRTRGCGVLGRAGVHVVEGMVMEILRSVVIGVSGKEDNSSKGGQPPLESPLNSKH